jgi:hypothetical protein
MENFKSYFKQAESEKENSFQEKWDVVLFTGDFSPINRDEYCRIRQFNEDVIGNEVHGQKFSSEVDLGVMVDHQYEDKDQAIEDQRNYELTLSEKAYIATKLFGLRLFPINFTEMIWMTRSSEHQEELNEENTLVNEFKNYFHNSNILIVLRPEERMFMNEFEDLQPHFRDKHLNVGFMVFEHDKIAADDFLKKIPMNSQMLKAVCMMDYEQPHPEDLKTFAHKYKLQDHLEHIKTLHFRCGGRYDLAFRSMFPNIKLNENDDDITLESNSRVVMEIIKAMYTKNKE